MKNFKYIYILFSLFLLSNIVSAQQKVKQQEFGIIFSDLDNFGLLYRIGNSNALWQLNVLSTSGSIHETGPIQTNTFSMAVEIGREFRKTIADPIELRYGGGFSFGYSSINGTPYSDRFSHLTYQQKQFRPGIYLMIGANYLINDRIILGAELLPSVSWVHSKIKRHERNIDDSDFNKITTIDTGWNYGFNMNSIRISLAYRLIKK